jgi:hypothetical protein
MLDKTANLNQTKNQTIMGTKSFQGKRDESQGKNEAQILISDYRSFLINKKVSFSKGKYPSS